MRTGWRVLLDMDGVVADFTAGACMVHDKPDPYLNPKNLGDYDIAAIMEIPTNDFWLPMGHEFWANLPLTQEANGIVANLSSMFGLENICILSSPNLNHESLTGKLYWIEKHLPAFKRRYLLGPRKQFCAAANHILVDDHDHNVNGFKEAGGNAFLYGRPWNSKHNMSAGDAYQEFLDYIESFA